MGGSIHGSGLRAWLLGALLLAFAFAHPAPALTLDDGGSHSLTGDLRLEDLSVLNATEAFIEPGAQVATGFFGFRFFVTIIEGSRVEVRGGELGGSGRWAFMGPGTEVVMTSGVIDNRGESRLSAGAGATMRLEGGTWIRTAMTDFVNAEAFEVGAEVDVVPVEPADLALANLARAAVHAGEWTQVTIDGLDDAVWNADAELIQVKGDGPVVMTGGLVVQLDARASGRVRIEGGVVDDLYAALGGSAVIEGGSLQRIEASGSKGYGAEAGTIELRGGSVGAMTSLEAASITVYGLEFEAPNGPLAAESGVLNGTLLDGTAIAASFTRDAGASIVVVPEPQRVLLVASSLALLAGLARARQGAVRGLRRGVRARDRLRDEAEASR